MFVRMHFFRNKLNELKRRVCANCSHSFQFCSRFFFSFFIRWKSLRYSIFLSPLWTINNSTMSCIVIIICGRHCKQMPCKWAEKWKASKRAKEKNEETMTMTTTTSVATTGKNWIDLVEWFSFFSIFALSFHNAKIHR